MSVSNNNQDGSDEIDGDIRVIHESGGGRYLASLIEPIIVEEGFDLVRLRLTRGARRSVQVMVERSDGSVLIDDCERLIKVLSLVPEELSGLRATDELEVSSPGLERPLVRIRDFRRAVDCLVRLVLHSAVDGSKRFSAVLNDVRSDSITVTRSLDRKARRARSRGEVDGESEEPQPVAIMFSEIESIHRHVTESEFRAMLASSNSHDALGEA